MAWEVHHDVRKRRYLTHCCSCACLLYTITVFVMVLLPFYISFASYSFWTKEKLVHEQPVVVFRKQAVLVVEGMTSAGAVVHKAWTTSASINALLGDDLTLASFTAWSEDGNADGSMDALQVKASIPLDVNSISIRRASLVAFLDYELDGTARLKMDSLAIIDEASALPAKALHVEGTLELQQRQKLRAAASTLIPYSGSPMWDDKLGVQLTDVASLVSRYMQRNYTTSLRSTAVWSTNQAYGVTQMGTAASSFDFTATIRVVPTQVLTHPAVAEMVKWAWVQYFSVAVVIWVAVQWLRMFIYGQRLVRTSVVTDGDTKLHHS